MVGGCFFHLEAKYCATDEGVIEIIWLILLSDKEIVLLIPYSSSMATNLL